MTRDARRRLFNQFNIPKRILNYTLGHNHPVWIRLSLGFIIVVFSGLITDGPIFLAAFRKVVEGLGLVPWMEWVSIISEEENQFSNNKTENHETVNTNDCPTC